jgi:hypothetical protein
MGNMRRSPRSAARRSRSPDYRQHIDSLVGGQRQQCSLVDAGMDFATTAAGHRGVVGAPLGQERGATRDVSPRGRPRHRYRSAGLPAPAGRQVRAACREEPRPRRLRSAIRGKPRVHARRARAHLVGASHLEEAAALFRSGGTVRAVAAQLGIARSSAGRLRQKALEDGLLDCNEAETAEEDESGTVH